jgi:glycosyltransferase involved in cell wall biosynthesis
MKESPDRLRKVLIIVENLPVPFDRRVWQQANTLCEEGYKVSVICPKGKGYDRGYERISNIDIYRFGLPIEASSAIGYALEYSIALVKQFSLSLRIFATDGIDIVHACNPPDTIFLIGLFYKLLGKKFIFDHHDINPELYEAKFGKHGASYRLLLLLERLTFKCADISIATNESYKQIAIDRGRMAPDKVFVVRSGPNLSRVRKMPENATLRHGKKFLVGYVGVIGQQEGIDLLLAAAQVIVYHRKRRDIHFTLVGDGPHLDNMIALADELRLNNFVTFAGRVSDPVLFEILSTSDVCVNPDSPNAMNDKSTMNKIMEYMALGKPIVQFDLKEGRVSAQQASVYAKHNDIDDFADKILDLLDNPEKRARMGAIGRERVEQKLSWEHEAPKLLKAYEAIYRR